MALLNTRKSRWLAAAVAFAILVALTPLWVRLLGHFLVREQAPFRADMIVALAGDQEGERILKAASLAAAGWAPRVLVSGPPCCYGRHESDMAIDFAVRHGYPRGMFIPLPIEGRSTREEAGEIVAALDREHVKRFIIVTSTYHSRRAGSIYAGLVSRDQFRVVAAPDHAFTPDGWWRTREGLKQTFFEWSKTLANWAGL